LSSGERSSKARSFTNNAAEEEEKKRAITSGVKLRHIDRSKGWSPGKRGVASTTVLYKRKGGDARAGPETFFEKKITWGILSTPEKTRWGKKGVGVIFG